MERFTIDVYGSSNPDSINSINQRYAQQTKTSVTFETPARMPKVERSYTLKKTKPTAMQIICTAYLRIRHKQRVHPKHQPAHLGIGVRAVN